MSKVSLQLKNNTKIKFQKRQHIPYIIDYICECTRLISLDMAENYYVPHPIHGRVSHVYIECDWCGQEHSVSLVINITADLI